MPRINHPNLGDVLKTVYLPGIINSVNSADDTCSVTVQGAVYLAVPIFYHCEPDAALRSNGAITGGSSPFGEDDAVIVQASISSGGEITVLRVMGFQAGLQECAFCPGETGSIILSPWLDVDLSASYMGNYEDFNETGIVIASSS